MIDLSPLGRVWVRGSDARDYLHRQMTGDISGVGVGEGCHTAALAGDGKMVAELSLHRSGESEFLAVTMPSCADAVASHLDRFIFSEDCTVDTDGEGRGLLAVLGPHAGRAVSPATGIDADALPDWGIAQSESTHVVRTSLLGPPGFLAIAAAKDLADLWTRFTEAGASPVGWEAIRVHRIEAGVPLFGEDHDATWVPNDAGIEQVISYMKGCFPGQEVVAKMHNVGHARHVLCGFVFDSDGPPPVGAALFAGRTRVGEVTSVCRSPRLGQVIGLGHLKWKAREPNQTLGVGEQGELGQATAIELPFHRPMSEAT